MFLSRNTHTYMFDVDHRIVNRHRVPFHCIDELEEMCVEYSEWEQNEAAEDDE